SWHTVGSSQLPLFARALVIQVGDAKWGLATADVLLIPPDVAREVQSRAAALGLQGMWVAATHTHSSWGGYDARRAAQWGGVGSFRPDARAALVEGLTSA